MNVGKQSDGPHTAGEHASASQGSWRCPGQQREGRPAGAARAPRAGASEPRGAAAPPLAAAPMAEALGLCQVQDTAGQIEAEERAAKLPAPGSLRTNGKPPANGQHSREAVSMPTRPQLDAAPADESLVHSESPCGIPGLARPPLALARCGGGCVRRCGCPRGAALCAVTSPRLQAAALAAWGVIACPRVCLPGPRTGHSGATSLHGRTESNAVRKEGLYHSARSPRGNRYIITPRGSYIDYSIENDSLTATSDGVCPPRPPPLRMLLRGPSCRISRAGSPLKYALRSAGRVLYLETEAADTSENKRHAG